MLYACLITLIQLNSHVIFTNWMVETFMKQRQFTNKNKDKAAHISQGKFILYILLLQNYLIAECKIYILDLVPYIIIFLSLRSMVHFVMLDSSNICFATTWNCTRWQEVPAKRLSAYSEILSMLMQKTSYRSKLEIAVPTVRSCITL